MLLSSLSWWNRCSLPSARCDHCMPPPPLPLPLPLSSRPPALLGLLLPPISSKNSAA